MRAVDRILGMPIMGEAARLYFPGRVAEGARALKSHAARGNLVKSVIHSIALASLLALAPASAFAWGAIAVSDGKGQSADDVGYGYSTGQDSEADAKKSAMKSCRAKNASCKVVVTFETCGAYAVSGNRWGTGEGETKGAARRYALANCGNEACRLVLAECDE